ncbi:alanine--tRNA ligase-related protein [Streptantibioticus cattleyicolor]|uniref:alanine--tRNA ligase n=1 Tax=Streptantibioticus cattleyicolor (strain ATCC 35852 / DSM 46488 / JCM 4925 / NBRC 14057 / NRRL 8057) TaxID=1003195 RepID=F8JKS5_STREN|nr:alanine--tRNA ligase-related protein [Streptantibioticus cattleyicolor]AEW98425.1 putative alanyl-tRNA synthetase [Streptantibioticus cattleyicolor NRRL 8057 = DSM 46488]CCB72517.1 putative alanyl-tRNA synthetase [Streptantibioticus cattleyicolor NRRL 8057 = DSM 46488]
MNTEEITATFTEYFQERGHRRITGSTLLPPPGDPVLFTTSGMHPLTPYLEGRPHPLGRRVVNVQRCLRTTDLDEVGDPTHLTVFEMLGTWSLGDYEGPLSLEWGYGLLTEGFGIDPGLLHATVFGGDEHTGPDTSSLEVWQRLGVPVERTVEDNWWSNGPTGPCGPDSEIFLWTGSTPPRSTPTRDDRWVEVWNHVMMRHRRLPDGSLVPLPQRNVDTGLGLERLASLLQGRTSVFECDVFAPWRLLVPALWRLDEPSLRLVCDHLRSAVVVIGDGVRPANTDRGYVLRRLVRRVLTVLWRGDPSRSLVDLPEELVEHTLHHFRLSTGPDEVRGVLLDEERRFVRLLERGRRVLARPRFQRPLDEEDLRYLHDTHGLPRDLVTILRPATGPADGSPRR